ncbi:MAG TPA: T9SS type A sorting domain-containing protein [Cytophagaceae bacterium]
MAGWSTEEILIKPLLLTAILLGTPGSNITITYEVNESTKLSFEYSIDGGTNWEIIDSWVNVNNGQYTWKVPDVNSTNCLLRLSDSYNSSIFGISDGEFTISAITETDTPTNEILNVFPNPSDNVISINFARQREYELVDWEGNIIFSGKTNSGTVEKINTLGIHPGVYILRLKSDNSIHTTKIIIK